MKHDSSLPQGDVKLWGKPQSKPYAWNRYWGRTHTIEILRQFGDLPLAGGESAIRTLDLHRISKILRSLDYTRVIVVEDDSPVLLGGTRNEPDLEVIYQVLKLNPKIKNSPFKLKQLYQRYRTNGITPISLI